jgi:branched-chain amino acid transport system substrate-binding protein
MLKLVKWIFTLVLAVLPAAVFAEKELGPLRIGAALSLTGIFAPFGLGELNAIRMAIDEVNNRGGVGGRKVELVVEDCQSTGMGTVTAVSKLIEVNSFKSLLGPTFLDSFQGALPILNAKSVLVLAPSTCIPIIKKSDQDFPLVFSTFFDLEEEARFLLEYMAKRGHRRIVLLLDNDPFWQTVERIIDQNKGRLGIIVLESFDFGIGDSDFKPALIRTGSLNPDAVLYGFNSESGLLNFLKQRKQLYTRVPLYTFHDVDWYKQDKSFSGLLDKLLYVTPSKPASSFVEKYQKYYGQNPMLNASCAYDAAQMLLQALAEGKDAPGQIAEYLQKTEFHTVTYGSTRFNAFGGIVNARFEVKSP